jgi:hypothetical protein
MNTFRPLLAVVVFASLTLLPVAPAAAESGCKAVHATLVEVPATTGCNPGLTSCFLGEVAGNHGLRGATHFRADSAAAGPSTGSPGFISYSGAFQYRTESGNLDVRETGVTNTGNGQPQSGAVTAYQQVVGGSGDFAGASGFLFVSGRRVNNVIETLVHGELCFAD